MSRRTPFVATLVAMPVLLGGCGLGDSIVGLHPAPPETDGGASVTQQTAKELSLRLLGEASEVRKDAKATTKERSQVFSGLAARTASAAARSKDKQVSSDSQDNKLQVLAVSRGSDWPRAVLATSRKDDTQFLHVFLSQKAGAPYTLFADVPMAAGASVPAFPPATEGTKVTLTTKPPKDVTNAITAWTKGVRYPAPKKAPTAVSFDDAFSKALKKNARDQHKDLNKLARYAQIQSLSKGTMIDFQLAEGGHLSFLPLTRTDKMVGHKKLKVLKVEDKLVSRLLGSTKVTKELSIQHAETIALVTPEKGKAHVVGVRDVLSKVSGN